MNEAHYTCIVCPKSCSITLKEQDGVFTIEGNECKRGAEYAQNEYLHPMQMLTTTVKVDGGKIHRLGVIGSRSVPKERLRECLQEVYKVTVCPPIAAGDVVLENVGNTGCNVLAAMSLNA